MIDAAKFADLALLLVDGSYGFEMVRSCPYLIDHLLHVTTNIFRIHFWVIKIQNQVMYEYILNYWNYFGSCWLVFVLIE